MENTQRDPSTPWKTPSGEWRLRTYDANVYGTASDADMLAGKWYKIGKSTSFRQCECPSFYPLPEATPGFEKEYAAHLKAGSLPTHVHKTSCGGDWWQVGTYTEGAPKVLGDFKATPGYEDLFAQKKIDMGNFYASKDNLYPTLDKKTRRINWGWATVPPQSAQTLPREITFNAAAHALQQYPIKELEALRGAPAFDKPGLKVAANKAMALGVTAVAKTSESIVSFEIPAAASTFGVTIGGLACTIAYAPSTDSNAAYHDVPVTCGKTKDTLRILAGEKNVEVRVFGDATFVEVFFQQGRTAMTVSTPLGSTSDISLTSTTDITAAAEVYPMKSIWVEQDDVRKASRVYN